MSTRYEVHIWDAAGANLLAVLANFADPESGAALEYALTVGQVGALSLTVPASFDPDLLPLDGRVSVWRSIAGRPPVMDGGAVYLIRAWRYTTTAITVTALHATHLLKRRIIAYPAGSSYASKTAGAAAGDLIKTVVSENMGAGIVAADRDGAETQADIAAYLTAQTSLGDGATLAMQAPRDNVFDVARDLCDASTTAGTYLTAEVVAPTETTLQLRTYATQRGVDRRASTSRALILSPDTGTLENCVLTVDRTEEATVAICGGQGEREARLIATAIDATRIADSPLNRIEVFGDYSNIDDAGSLQDIADALLRASRPRITFEADLVETPGATRGIHYDVGDMLTASWRGQQYDVRLDAVSVSISGGQATTRAQLRSVT